MDTDTKNSQVSPDADANNPYNRQVAGTEDNAGEPDESANTSKSISPAELKDQENKPKDAAAVAAGATGAAETTDINERSGGLYSGDERPGRLRRRFGISRRKGVTGGIIGLVLGGGVFFGFGIASGPLQVVHLGEVLLHSFSKNNSDSANRTNKLYRFARGTATGDIGETRVGRLGSKVYGRTIKQLGDIGVEVERSASGAPTKVNIDTEKLKAQFPELEHMNDADKISFLEDKLGVSGVTGAGDKFNLDAKSFGIKSSGILTKSTVKLLGDGKIVGGIKTRIFTKFFNLPSLFHPLKRALASRQNSAAAAKAQEEEKKAEEERQKALADPVAAEGDAAAQDAKSKSSGLKSGVVKALTFTGGACFARSIAGDIPKIDEARIMLPAAVHATDLIAVASQIESGQDLTASQVGVVVHDLSDSKGNTVWQGKALQVLENGNSKGLSDISLDEKQGFSSHTTAAAIKKYADDSIGGGVSAKIACSGIGQAIQAIAAVVVSAVGELATAGEATPAIIAAIAAKQGASFAGSAVFFHFLQKVILDKTTAGKLAIDAFQGPAGGSLIAYGSRAAANLSGIASGGVSLGNNTSTFAAAADQQQFKSESMFARVFDTKDYRSLTGHLADSISPSLTQNFSSALGGLTHIGSLFSGLVASLVPKATADAQQTYDWGFPQYGLPSLMLNSVDLEDPYANATQVAKLLDSNGQNGTPDYISRASKCFGVNIAKSSSDGVWDVVPVTRVDPESDDYRGANCDKYQTDQNWQRVIMFVFDTSTMKAAACYQGDTQSCNDAGTQ